MAKKSFLDSINVPAPCDKNWDEMTGDEQKRFCSGCQKNVFNVSAMPHREASRLIAENAGKICICYTRLPNGRVMTTDQKLHQISRRTSAVAAGVIAATLTFSAMTYAQGGSRIEPQKSGSVSITQIVPPSRSQAKLTVIVTDLNGAVIPKARILLKDIKRNIVSEGLSDNNGFYEFASIQPSVYEIQIIKDGFEPLVKSDVQFAGDKTLEIRIALETASIVGLYVSPEAIESESQKSSAEITSRQLLDLPPSKNRPFIGLVLANSKTKTKRGAIFLTVVDESGTIVPGTQIKLTNQKTKEVFSVLADQDGQAQLGLMLYGKYLVTASAPGFAEYRQIIESSKKVKTNISITLKVMNYPLMGDFTIEDPVTVEKT